MTERAELRTPDGIVLETKIDSPDGDPSAVIVFCHPHPLQGGTMNAPLMIAITRRLVDHGLKVVRFNFRGSGKSTGEHDYGTAELVDVSTVMEDARTLELPLGIAGWSFGAGVALNWLSQQDDGMPYVGVAPPPDVLPDELPTGPKRIVLGTREQVVDAVRLQDYTVEKGIDLVLTPGDHFFHGRGEKVGELVAQGFEVLSTS